jgi:hypothetical protein
MYWVALPVRLVTFAEPWRTWNATPPEKVVLVASAPACTYCWADSTVVLIAEPPTDRNW